MAVTTSPNMFMPVPGVGTEQGPNYSLDINACLSLIDSHDHSLGRGVQITPAGININTAFTLNSNNLTDVGGIAFTALGSNPSTIQFLYVSPGVETPLTEDLWFNDGNGNQVQITNNGLVNATIASIPGESFAGGTFFWKQGAGSTTPANFDIGSITLRPNTPATTFGVRLQPPAGITSQYDISLPLLPIINSIMFIDASGTITTNQFITNSNIADNSISGNKITDSTLSGSKIVDATVTLAKLDPTVLQWNTATFTLAVATFAVRAATTVNGTFATAFDNASVIDGITLTTGDIILVKNQTTSTEDGVYVVQASGAPVRHVNYDTFSELNYAGVTVTLGTVNAATSWFQNNVLTSLSDPQSWSRSSSAPFTVPVNVNQLNVTAIGGGGGGGGDGTNQGAGGGGAGAHGLNTISVVPGEVVSVTIGIAGAGGAAGVGVGLDGSSGGDTVIIGSLGTLYYPGGGGGGHGGGGSTGIGKSSLGAGGRGGATGVAGPGGGGGGSNGVGGDGATSAIVATDGSDGSGGGGGFGSTAGSSGAGGKSFFSSTTAAGGATAGGGGGGGTGFAIGGVGGTGGGAGANAPVANSGAGGGGGSATGGGGGAGGAGANGKVIIRWLGAP